MKVQHTGLAGGGWARLTLMEQLGNIGSEVGRSSRWHNRDQDRYEGAFVRALELLDLTMQDPRWRGRRKEIARSRELLCDAHLGGHAYRSTFDDLERYFSFFAIAARLNR